MERTAKMANALLQKAWYRYSDSFDGNLTQEKYFTFTAGLLSNGFESAAVGEPRMFGFRVRAHF
jgi:hypothetical protein